MTVWRGIPIKSFSTIWASGHASCISRIFFIPWLLFLFYILFIFLLFFPPSFCVLGQKRWPPRMDIYRYAFHILLDFVWIPICLVCWAFDSPSRRAWGAREEKKVDDGLVWGGKKKFVPGGSRKNQQ